MADAKQIDKDMEYLMHVLRNGTAKMEGCLREVETFCADMRRAIETFKVCLLEETINEKERIMGSRSWMKYLAIMAAFAGIGARVFVWLRQAQSAGSPGGEEITAEEIPELQTVITDAINNGLQAGDVPLLASVTFTYIGD